MYKINKLQHGKHFARDFSHLLVLCLYSRAFHEVAAKIFVQVRLV